MPTWSYVRPDPTVAWNIGGAKVRENFQYLEQALQVISTFAINASDPLDRMATKVGFGILTNRPTTTLASQAGSIYFATDVKQLYVCTNGVVNTWTSLARLGTAATTEGDLTVTGNLLVAGSTQLVAALLLQGAVTVDDNVTLNSGFKLIGPTGESWLRQNSVDMNPHAHSVRHRPGHTDGAWDANNDFLPYSTQRILQDSTLSNTVLTNSVISSQTIGANALLSIAFSTVGRGTTSRFLVYFELVLSASGNAGVPCELEVALVLDATTTKIGDSLYESLDDTIASGEHKTLSGFRYMTGVSDAAHTVAVMARDINNETWVAQTGTLILIDLGTE